MTDYGDKYYTNGKVRGRCSVCGDTKQHRSQRSPKYWKPYYFRIFQKLSIFRGEDEYLGMICKQCLDEGHINRVNKFHPNQLKDELEADTKPNNAVKPPIKDEEIKQ